MLQMARRAVDAIDGPLLPIRSALHDRDTKFCTSFRAMLGSAEFNLLCCLPAVRT